MLIAVLTDQDILLFGLVLFFVLAGLLGYFFYTFFSIHPRVDASPYSGMPLRKGREITYEKKDKIFQFLNTLSHYENRPFDLEKAAFCRETGRIFPNAINWSGKVSLDWGFIVKCYRGNYVSWGSLSPEKQKEIKQLHGSLEGFQLQTSSQNASPRLVEEKIALIKPGPLYVDPETNVLVGWKIVPGTELEVLVVQKPLIIKLINVNQNPHVKR